MSSTSSLPDWVADFLKRRTEVEQVLRAPMKARAKGKPGPPPLTAEQMQDLANKLSVPTDVAAPSAPQPTEPVAVKPLQWRDVRGDGSLAAFTEMGLLYTVSDTAWGNTRDFPAANPANGIEAAKSAAQADYNARILAALASPVAQQRDEVIEASRALERGSDV